MNIEKLLNKSNESMYWLGFLLADGSIVNNRLRLCLSNKDEAHIMSFIKYTNAANTINRLKTKAISIAYQNKKEIPKLAKYGIVPNKTYEPVSRKKFERLNSRQFLCLLIGFIDGDGCIRKQTGRKDCLITIKCHKNWLDILCYFSERISKLSGDILATPIINNNGYARLNITRINTVNYLKKKAIELKLPILDRKWSHIDETLVSRSITTINNRLSILALKSKGYNNIEIARKMNLSPAAITKALK